MNLEYANKNVRSHYKIFQITNTPKNNIEQPITHKHTVRYLGIHLDERLHYKNHLEIQFKKAIKAFMQHKKLFYFKHLHPKVKIICYQLLIRPIITYGCPIWYNISAALVEKIQIFERKCLRACLSMYRSAHTDYTEYINNLKLYNSANIPRIDNYIINLIREHYLQASKIKINSLIHCAIYPNPLYHERTLNSGFIPPEAFLYLDQI